MSQLNQLNDLRQTRLYELLLHLKPKQRKIIVAISNIKEVPIDAKKITLLTTFIKNIEKRSPQPLPKATVMKKSGYKSDAAFNYATSDLFKMVCKMLYLINILKDNAPPYLFSLADLFIDKDLPINAHHVLNDLKKHLKNRKTQVHDYHLYQMKYHELHLEKNQSDRKAHDEHFFETNQHLDAFYTENKLRLLCEQLNRNRIVQESTTVLPSDRATKLFLELVEVNEYFQSPSIECYFLIYQMLLTKTESSYQTAANKIKTDGTQLPPTIEETMIAYLKNQCIYFINNNIQRVHYANEYIQYIDLLDEKNYLLKHGKLSPTRFQGIVVAGITAQQIEWVTDFVKQKAEKLNSSHKDFIEKTHLAYIAFHTGDVEKAHNIIRVVESNRVIDPFFNVLHYKLMIQIFFHKDLLILAQDKVLAFKKYISRKDKKEIIAPEKVGSLQKFISYILKIIQLKEEPNTQQSDYSKVQKRLLEDKGTIAYIDWLKQILIDAIDKKK